MGPIQQILRLFSLKTFLFTFQAIALQVDYFVSPRITTGQRSLDEPHSLVKIIDGIELKA